MQLQPGETILGDKFRIERLLGRGAFGEVYLATHLELNVPRAVKVLHRDAPGLGSTAFADYRGRFKLEAEVGAHLDDPNVVRVYDFEETDGVLCLVMAYCPGGSLKDRLARARETGQLLPVEEVRRIGTDVARGLAAIHAREVIHRDLKPSNILFDAKDCAQIGDLGLAQVPGASTRGTLTSSPALDHPGTPEYMSPEQETSKSRLRPPSDVYALGAVLFEMLTGQLYNNSRPGTHARALRPETPRWLDNLIARMLAPKLEDRPWDGAEAAKLLQRGRPSTKPGPRIWIAAALVLAALLAGARWVSYLLAQPAATATPPVLTAAPGPVAPSVASPTVTAEPTPAPTPVPEPTKSPAPTAPIVTPTSTAVPEPSATMRAVDTATSAPAATRRPSATNTATAPILLPAPILEAPEDRATFGGKDANITLSWRSVKPALAADEYYLITLVYAHEKETWTDYAWTKSTQWAANEHDYLPETSNDGRFTWAVRLVRAAAVPAGGEPTGAEVRLSDVSQSRVFVWTIDSGTIVVPTLYPPP